MHLEKILVALDSFRFLNLKIIVPLCIVVLVIIPLTYMDSRLVGVPLPEMEHLYGKTHWKNRC